MRLYGQKNGDPGFGRHRLGAWSGGVDSGPAGQTCKTEVFPSQHTLSFSLIVMNCKRFPTNCQVCREIHFAHSQRFVVISE